MLWWSTLTRGAGVDRAAWQLLTDRSMYPFVLTFSVAGRTQARCQLSQSLKESDLKNIHGREADYARAIAQHILDRLCGLASHPVPVLHVVDRLPGSGKKSGRDTAKATFKGGPGIILPAALAGTLSQAGLEHLLAHELGHLVLHRSRWARTWNWLAAGFIVLAAVLLAASVVVVSAFKDDSLLPQMAAVSLVLVLGAAVMLMAYANRQHEIECDLFAVRLQGHLEGASDHMEHYARLKEKAGYRERRMDRLIASHPDPHDRLQRMTDSLAERDRSNAAADKTPGLGQV